MAAITYKCPNCGGGLVFDPGTQKYKCEYCLSLFDQQELEDTGPDREDPGQWTEGNHGQEEALRRQSGPVGAVSCICPSCGAQVVTDETTAATFCYYCHNPVVIEGRLKGGYHPDYVIPFSIDRKQAEEIFRNWIGGKRFVPRDFYSPRQVESMTGVYFPYWLYSCQVDGRMDAEGIRMRVWDAGNLRYTEQKIYQVSRSGRMEVENVARNALKKNNVRLSEGVLPFLPEGRKPFHMSYLTGFQAERRDMEAGELAAEVEREVKNQAASRLRESADGYSSLRIKAQTEEIENARWYYGLFPVWTLTYKSPRDGKIYYFALNGQTGKVCGELPVDRKGLAALFLAVFLPLLILFLMGGYFL